MHGPLPLHQAGAGPGRRPITIVFVTERTAGIFLRLFPTALKCRKLCSVSKSEGKVISSKMRKYEC